MAFFGIDLGSEVTYLVSSNGNIVRNELGRISVPIAGSGSRYPTRSPNACFHHARLPRALPVGGHSSGSLVAFTDSGRVIGEEAVGQASTNPKHTVENLHLLLGMPHVEVASSGWAKHCSYATASGEGGATEVSVRLRGENRAFRAEALTAMLLRKLASLAAGSAGGAGAPAFAFAVPPWFTPAAKAALLDACAIAGVGERAQLVDAPEALARVFAKKHPVAAPKFDPKAGEEAAAAAAAAAAAGRAHLIVDVGATHVTVTVVRFFAPGHGPGGGDFEVLAAKSTGAGGGGGVGAMDHALFDVLRSKAFAKVGAAKAGNDFAGFAVWFPHSTLHRCRRACHKTVHSLSPAYRLENVLRRSLSFSLTCEAGTFLHPFLAFIGHARRRALRAASACSGAWRGCGGCCRPCPTRRSPSRTWPRTATWP